MKRIMDTYLNKEQVKKLAEVFANEEQYTEYLATLWALRRVVYTKIEMGYIDESHPQFKVFDFTNRVINAIDDGSISIVNGMVNVDKRNKRQ